MRWAEPGWLVLLILAAWPWVSERRRARVGWPTLAGFEGVGSPFAIVSATIPPLLLSAAIVAMVVALARPQSIGERTKVTGRGLAIVVAIDRSSSMKADDFSGDGLKITRLDAAKAMVSQFLGARGDDLVGVVAFANYPDLTCPPTLDGAFVTRAVAALSPAVGPEDGTNLGDAIAWSLDALRKSDAVGRVLILLTDGHNDPNVPEPLDPRAAARLCAAMGVTLHTIAVGDAGGIVRSNEPVSGLPLLAEVGGPDLALLEELAHLGGGRAFRATSPNALHHVFDAIDTIEPSPVSSTVVNRYRERFGPWAAGAMVCLGLERLLRAGRFARLP